jgi:thiol-disulfide isomerase/thioredoxin
VKWIKHAVLYGIVIIVLFSGQFLFNRGLVSGVPPQLPEQTIAGLPTESVIPKGGGIIYFWADWCGLCGMMQSSMTKVLQDTPGITVALNSGPTEQVNRYLASRNLNWPTVNDADGSVAKRYGIKGVPAILFLNKSGHIVFSSIGYSTEFGLRFRVWLASYFN